MGVECLRGRGDVTITQEQLEKLASELAAGYQSYAASNGLPDPSRMGEYFLDYLGTDDAKQQLAAGIAGMVDTGSLESQISGAVQSYMGQVMSSLSGEMAQSLETQITSAVTQVMGQISTGMESAMEQAAARLGENMQNAMSIDPEAFCRGIHHEYVRRRAGGADDVHELHGERHL